MTTAIAVKLLEWRKGYCDERVTIQQASNGWLYQVRILDGVIWLDWPDRAATFFPSEAEAKAAAQADYERRILAALTPHGEEAAATPAPQQQMVGSVAIRKAGDAAVQKLVDRFALTHFMPDSDDLTDYLRSIVDACVKAAAEKPE